MSLTSLINANQQEMEEYISKFDKRLEGIFKKINTMATVEIVNANIDDVLDFDIVWADILQESGYNDLIQRYVNTLDDMQGSISKILDEAGLLQTLTDDKKHRLLVARKLQIKDLQKIGMDKGLAMKKGLYNNILAGKSKADLLAAMEVELQGSKYQSYAKTYASTGINDYRQAVINQRVEAFQDDEDVVWIYEGNDVDKVTRDFCKHILNANKAYSTSEKNKLESDKRRKWNCRHTFIPMYKEDAMEEGYKVKGTVKKKEEAKKVKDIKAPAKTKVKKIEVPEIKFGYDGKFDGYVKDIRPEAKVVIDRLPKPKNIIEVDESYSEYLFDTKTVQTSKNRNTFTHEYGHHIDSLIGSSKFGGGNRTLSYNGDYDIMSSIEADKKLLGLNTTRLKKPVESLKSKFYEDYERISPFGRKSIQSRLKSDDYVGFSDIIDASIDGKAYDKYGMSGHGGRYYKYNGTKETEIFANMFQVWSTQDKWDEMKALFPNTASKFELIMKDISSGKFD